MEENELLAGVAQIDISPPLGVLISGHFLPRYAREIHDPLFVKGIFFQYADIRTVIIVIDNCSMSEPLVNLIKTDLFKRFGLTKTQILIAVTHTHSGPAIDDFFLDNADKSYIRVIQNSCVGVVEQALLSLQPATIAFGSIEVPEYIVCRRYRMKDGFNYLNPITDVPVDKVMTNPFGYEEFIQERSGTVDPALSFLGIKSLSGTWLGLLANYSLHYVGDFPDDLISADYFGYFAAAIKNKLQAPDSFVGIMTNGTSGNANIWDFLTTHTAIAESFTQSKKIAYDLADRILEELPNLKWEEKVPLEIVSEQILVKVRKPTAKELENAKSVMKGTDYTMLRQVDEGSLRSIYAREQVLLYDQPDDLSVFIQLIRLGKNAIGAFPGELFGETGLLLKKTYAPNFYFSICLANGNMGYMPPVHEFKNGGYETWRCRTSKLEENTETLIRNKMVDLFNNRHS